MCFTTVLQYDGCSRLHVIDQKNPFGPRTQLPWLPSETGFPWIVWFEWTRMTPLHGLLFRLSIDVKIHGLSTTWDENSSPCLCKWSKNACADFNLWCLWALSTFSAPVMYKAYDSLECQSQFWAMLSLKFGTSMDKSLVISDDFLLFLHSHAQRYCQPGY